MNNVKLIHDIDQLPDDLKKEVENFVEYLVSKTQKGKIPVASLEGKWKGLIQMSDDFDEPLEDFKEYMK
jgi:hypothetical protein